MGKKILLGVLFCVLLLTACQIPQYTQPEGDINKEIEDLTKDIDGELTPEEKAREEFKQRLLEKKRELQSDASIEVVDQAVNTEVSGISGSIDQPGFVVIHSVKNGQFADVVGNSGLLQGSFANVRVPVNGAMTGELIAMLHYDTNNNGVYEFGKVADADGPVVKQGEVILTQFKVIGEAMIKEPTNSVAQPEVPSISVAAQTVKDRVTGIKGNLDKPGFAVVHLVKDGQFAEVVGNSDVTSGKFDTEILIKGKPTDKLNVMLHYDTNNNGKYEFGKVANADGPVIVNGNVVMAEFTVLTPSKASVSVADQGVTGRVTGISGTIDKPGFVVVHLVKDGQFAEVVGNSVKLEGDFKNLQIPISTKTERLNIMLHYDTNNNGRYEFGQVAGVDGPVTINGNVVMTEIADLTSGSGPTPAPTTQASSPVRDSQGRLTLNAKEGDLIALNLRATDPDGDPLTYTFTSPLNSQGKWQTQRGDAGDYQVKLGVSDGENTVEETLFLSVAKLNNPPIIPNIPTITVNEGERVVLNVDATDADGDQLSYTYSGWMTSATYQTTYQDAGKHTVTVSVSDGLDTVTRQISVVVNDVNRPPAFVFG